MTFNHYARLKTILENEPDGWIIRRVDEPTSVKNFKNETVDFPHYYRLYDYSGMPIKYGKFQQLDRLAAVLGVPAEHLPVAE